VFGRLFDLICTRLFTHFSAVHSVVIVCAGDIRLLLKLLLKFRNVLKHTESRNSFACSQNIRHPHSAGGFPLLWKAFETKQNETNPHPHPHPRNARVISAEELSKTSKNNLRGITVVRGPIWEIHSLTLMISCVRTIKFFPPVAWSSLVSSNFRRASRMQGCDQLLNGRTATWNLLIVENSVFLILRWHRDKSFYLVQVPILWDWTNFFFLSLLYYFNVVNQCSIINIFMNNSLSGMLMKEITY